MLIKTKEVNANHRPKVDWKSYSNPGSPQLWWVFWELLPPSEHPDSNSSLVKVRKKKACIITNSQVGGAAIPKLPPYAEKHYHILI